MRPEQAEIISPKAINFPAEAKEGFIAYVNEHCGTENPYTQFESRRYALAMRMYDLLSEAKTNGNIDAGELLEFAENIRNGKKNPPFIVHNFPTDAEEDLLPPPTGFSYKTTYPPSATGKKGYITEWALEAFNTLCGLSPIQDQFMQAGNRYHWLIPQQGKETLRTAAGSELFEWHTEVPYRKNNDMQLMLLALRNKKTPTTLLPIEQLQAIFESRFFPEEIDLMAKGVYKFTPESTNGNTEISIRPMIKRDGNGKFTELQMHGYHERIGVDEEKAQELGLDVKELQAVLHKMFGVLAEINQGVILHHGDLLVFDNLTNLHSRTPLHPDDRIKGEERHLMRTQSYADEEVRKKMNQEISSMGRT